MYHIFAKESLASNFNETVVDRNFPKFHILTKIVNLRTEEWVVLELHTCNYIEFGFLYVKINHFEVYLITLSGLVNYTFYKELRMDILSIFSDEKANGYHCKARKFRWFFFGMFEERL